ncbi:MAG: YigZ family protein [Oscillospiraceae bacterium]|nr:YigZ family protein [Oscillospiraceae bacterium]
MDYITIGAPAQTSFIEKKSEFIGYLSPVRTNEEAVDFINQIKSEHRKAKHHVYAYLLRDSNITRYSDDGEPQGTAGVPVLEVLRKRELTDVCCVVVRYFGGILLGGGGLVRAYSHSASITCDSAQIQHICESTPLTLRMDYTLYGKVTYCLPKYGVLELNSDFNTDVLLDLLVRNEVLDDLKAELTELSGGKIQMQCGMPSYADFSSVLK